MRKTRHFGLPVLQLSRQVRSGGRPTLKNSKAPGILGALLVLSLAFALFLRLSEPGISEQRRTFPVLGTFATVIVSAREENIPEMMQKADSLLRHLDTQLGRFSETGQLHSLNTSYRIPAATELGRLVILSDSLVRATSGYFDPTMGIVSEVWGFPMADHVPDSAAIAEALAFTGWENRVHTLGDTITVEPGTYLDFGAIAKGWAVDRTYRMLRDMGAEECLVEVGGEIMCGSSTGRQWNLGVRHPREEELVGILTVTEGAVATSGDYECFFIQNGVRYSHLINRETGYPSVNAAGATVIAGNCATADAMATAAALAGLEGAESFPENSYASMIIITEDTNGVCEIHQIGEVPWGR